MAVTNQGGKVIVVNTPSLSLTLSEKGGQTVSSFVGDALKDGKGLQTVSIEHDGKPLVEATENDAGYFHRIDVDRLLFEGETKQGLMIETPSFKDGNKWRFFDGQSTMAIAIEDADFLQRVDDGEAFHKGDVLIAMVRWTQYRSGAQLKTERAIVRVIDHLERVGDQYPMNLQPPMDGND